MGDRGQYTLYHLSNCNKKYFYFSHLWFFTTPNPTLAPGPLFVFQLQMYRVQRTVQYSTTISVTRLWCSLADVSPQSGERYAPALLVHHVGCRPCKASLSLVLRISGDCEFFLSHMFLVLDGGEPLLDKAQKVNYQ